MSNRAKLSCISLAQRAADYRVAALSHTYKVAEECLSTLRNDQSALQSDMELLLTAWRGLTAKGSVDLSGDANFRSFLAYCRERSQALRLQVVQAEQEVESLRQSLHQEVATESVLSTHAQNLTSLDRRAAHDAQGKRASDQWISNRAHDFGRKGSS